MPTGVTTENLRAVILAGPRDFGRCPIASRLPVALWPVVDRPALLRLLDALAASGLKRATVCSNGDAALLKQGLAVPASLRVDFMDESMPAGTAGALRDAADGDSDASLLVINATTVTLPNIGRLLHRHRTGKSDITVALNPLRTEGSSTSTAAEIYICEPSILQYIPEEGYCDIKETLINSVLRAGKSVAAVDLAAPVRHFRNRREYVEALTRCLEHAGKTSFPFAVFRQDSTKTLWLASDVRLAPSVKVYGPVVILDGAEVADNCVLFGPTIIGRNTHIGADTMIAGSVLWDGAEVGRDCQVQKSLLDYNSKVPDNTLVDDETVAFKSRTRLRRAAEKSAAFAGRKLARLHSLTERSFAGISSQKHVSISGLHLRVSAIFIGAILSAAFVWSYWSGIVDLWGIWQKSDEYSSGLLVPFLAIYILWSRRCQLSQCRIQPCLWGLAALLAAQGLRGFGLFFMYSSAERLSLVLSIASLVLLLLGWQVFRKAFSVLLFLGLMLPLPHRVHNAVMLPLQELATSSAVFCLEILGYAVVQEGNVIHLNGTSVAVAEACNGLRMVMAFFVIVSLVVLLARRTWWEKLIVLVSGLPAALLCNTVRLTITAIAFTFVSGQRWETLFHDFGGYAMMPLAIGIVLLEFWLLKKLTTVPEERSIQVVTSKTKG